MTHNMFKDKVVSIVGSAGYLEDNEYGHEIDDADIVVRINKGSNVLSEENYKHLGRKTDVLYHCLLEDPPGSSGLKTGFITPEAWLEQGVKTIYCLPSSNMSGLANGNYLSDLVNIKNVKKLGELIPLAMVDFRFYNDLSSKIKCKPNTGVTAIFHILSNNPKTLKIYGFSFMLDGWYKDYRDPSLFDTFEWSTGERIDYEQAVERGFQSKRHKQKETWQYCKNILLNNDSIYTDSNLTQILEMDEFSREEYKRLKSAHVKK